MMRTRRRRRQGLRGHLALTATTKRRMVDRQPQGGSAMFQVTRNGKNRIDVDFTGKLDSIDMRIALNQLTQHAEGIEQGRMMYRIGTFELPTLGAIGVELSRIPQLLRFIRRFERVAVVADQEWVRRISTIEGALIVFAQVDAQPAVGQRPALGRRVQLQGVNGEAS